MFQAQHKQLMHETNVAVVNIRSIELGYFMNFFTNFGVNAAVGFGLIAGSVSQVPGYDNPTGCWYGFIVLYWVTSALTVVSSIFALITEIYVVVYGQGLALRGPSGSMVKAIDGMIDEQKTIFWAFNATLLFLGLQQIGMYFIMMDSTSAWITGALTLVAMFSWYRYGLRLYNRFNWDKLAIAWKEEEEKNGAQGKAPTPIDNDDIDPITRLEQSLRTQQQQQQQTQQGQKSTAATAGDKKRSVRLSVMSSLSTGKTSTGTSKGGAANKTTREGKSVRGSVMGDQPKSNGDGDSEDDDNEGRQMADQFEEDYLAAEEASQVDEANEIVRHMGFLSIRIPRKRTLFQSLVQGTSIFYYTDRRAYESDPTKPLNPRPIELDGYTLIGGAQVAPYYISLVPADPEDDRKAWKFRCDTMSEFTSWLEIFTSALRKCPSWRHSEAAEFIDIAATRADPHQHPNALADDSDEDD
eukprot:gene1575-1144_t